MSALLMLLPAWALDAHGPPVAAPTGDSPADPVTVWVPDLTRQVVIATTVEYANDPLMRQIDTGSDLLIQPILDNVWLTTLSARVPITRGISLSLGLPFFFNAEGVLNDPPGQPYRGLGDVRLGLPISFGKRGGLQFGVMPEVAIPTGGSAAFVGSEGMISALGMIGQTAGAFSWGVNAGIDVQPGATVDASVDTDLDRTAQLRLGASVGWRPLGWLGVGAELWSAPSVSGSFSDAPTEGLLRAGFGLPAGFSVGVDGGTTLSGAPGSASQRLHLRLQWNQPLEPEPEILIVDAPPPPPPLTPYDLVVTVEDGTGQPLDALLSVRNGPPPLQIGADGAERLTLAPGLWEVELSADGRETQRRTVLMEADRYQPVRLSAILLPDEGGAAEVKLEVLDYQGAPVNGATVSIDGRARGQTSTGGTLGVTGLREGERAISVDAPDFRPTPSSVQLGPGPTTQRLYLLRPPGSLRVVTRTEIAPVGDAMLRLIGPEEVPETAVGEDGEHMFVLAPGNWTVLASSAAYGMQEREVVIDAEGQYQEVEFLLQQRETGMAALLVRVIDPDGQPVEGAEVMLEGHRLGSTGTAGTLKVVGLQPGSRSIQVSGDHFRAVEPRAIELVDGLRETVIVLPWKPGSVQVVARGPEGALIDAQVRWVGAAEIPADSLGPDGEALYTLDPGPWELFISSSTFGLQERSVQVRPEDVQLVEIDARLLRPEGEAALELTILDPDGAGPGGAAVEIDGQPVGTTGPGGVLRVASLAPGKHTVRVDGELLAPLQQSVTLRDGDNRVQLRPKWEGRRLKITARTADGAAPDTLLRMVGAEVLPPVPVLPDGTRTLAVDPGPWTVLASSERFGMAEQDISVAPGTTVQPVEMLLAPPAPATADLLIEIVDPAGRPVEGLQITVNEQPYTPGSDSRLVLSDVPVGPVKVSAAAAGYQPLAPQTVPLVAGSQQRQLRMQWLPRVVRVRITDERGDPIDARVRLTKEEQTLSLQTGSDGTGDVPLTPGAWQLLIDGGADHASAQQELTVLPGGDPQVLALTLARSKIEVTEAQVVIQEQVFFAFDRALIEDRSFPILSEVAATLSLHPEIRRVEIQGHTDDKGDDAVNLALSQARAEAVRDWLIRAGVDPARLVAVGYGSARPVAPNTSESNRKKNRRVQFDITERQ